VGKLADRIQQISGTKLPVESDDQRIRPAASEVGHLQADSTLASQLLGWHPSIGLEEGLQMTWDWFVRNENRKKRSNGSYVI